MCQRASKLLVRAVCIDISGVLEVGNRPVPGAVAAISRLRSLPVDMFFLSNTTMVPRLDLVRSLRDMGFDLELDDVMTALSATRRLVEERGLNPLLLVTDHARKEFANVTAHADVCRSAHDSVVVGFAPSSFDYTKMNEAFNVLNTRNGAPLIAMHKGRSHRSSSRTVDLGPGAFVAGLEFAANVEAEVIGKPSTAYFHAALRELGGIAPESCVMIGDDIDDDIAGAQALGMRGILVKTGKFMQSSFDMSDVCPDYLANDLADAVEWLERHTE